ncbi:non-heme chloroperoxidase [Streptomyces sp. NL15-2K]|nr:alpha/beta hydrolase [Kutzneria buriramensis]WKX15250.1 alpha/beta hydrolase [Kutzneria buriramensis]GCB52370.1 non-heme chloroperoxidase [Streptomyces sp. NL15-2K]
MTTHDAQQIEQAGFAPVSLSWPDDPDTVAEANEHPEVFAGKTVGQVADHLAELIGGLTRKPAVVGHSFGGLLTQILAGRGLSAASVAIDPAPFRGGAVESPGVRRAFWLWSMQAGLKAAYDCVKQFSETDFTEDLRRIDVPTLVAHGDDDQIVPIAASAEKTAQLVKDATLKVYPGGPHGLVGDFERAFNADLLDFIGS